VAALCEYYARVGVSVSAAEVLGTTGGSEAIAFAMNACADHGDEALVVEPFYTNYAAFAAMAGVRLVPLTARGEDGFHLPPRDTWERALSGRTRMVLLCNPNNPTGTVYSRDELLAVAEFCRDHGLFLVCDEVYREFTYDGRSTPSALTLPGFEELVVVVDSLSKRYSACGIRLGCLVTRNRDVYAAALRMAQARLSPPGLAQAAAAALTEVGPEYTRAVVAEYQARRDMLFDAVSAIPGAFLRKPEGAFYFVARLPVLDADDFARFLLTDYQHEGATVMVAPARGFYATEGLGANEARLAYVLKRADLAVAVRVLETGLVAYRKARGLEGLEAVSAGGRRRAWRTFSSETGWPPVLFEVIVSSTNGGRRRGVAASRSSRRGRSTLPLNGCGTAGVSAGAAGRSTARAPTRSRFARVVSKWVLPGTTSPRWTRVSNSSRSAARPWCAGITCGSPVTLRTASSNR
jgi:aspartate aminotransferase